MQMTAQAVQLGPLIAPWSLIILCLSIGLAIMIGLLLKQRFQLTVMQWRTLTDSVWTALLIGLLAARIFHVLLHLSDYLHYPIEIIKIQDKGFNLYAGIVAGLGWILWINRSLAKKFLLALIVTFSLINLTGLYVLNKLQHQYQQFPDLTLQNLQHETIQLSDYNGKITVINLWASWCPPCRREMPALAQAEQDYPQVQFVLVNQGEDADQIKAFLQQHKMDFKHILLDPQGLTATKTGMFGLPSTLFFDADGRLVDTHMGELTHAALKQKIHNIIAP